MAGLRVAFVDADPILLKLAFNGLHFLLLGPGLNGKAA